MEIHTEESAQESHQPIAYNQATSLEQLKSHIRTLAHVHESNEPFISCYLNIQPGGFGWRETLEKKAALYRKLLSGPALEDFEDCLHHIQSWLSNHLLPTTRGVAIFARGGHGGHFWLPMQFSVSLPNLMTIYPTPNLYHLIELNDNHHSYILVIAKKDCAYILEVNLGEASIQSWIENPKLFKRVGTEWSKLHYQVNKPHQSSQYFDEQIETIRRLLHQNQLSHLILSGDPDTIYQFKHQLPVDIEKKLVDVVPSFETDAPSDVVLATLTSFIQHEERESQHIADKLVHELSGENLAVAGTADTFDALLWGEVDTVVVSSQYHPDPGWRCTSCNIMGMEVPEDELCKSCGKSAIQPVDIKEAILRLASQQDIPVEVVDYSDLLMAVGGIGCLLRRHKT